MILVLLALLGVCTTAVAEDSEGFELVLMQAKNLIPSAAALFAGTGSVGLLKLFKNYFLIGFRNPGSRIRHRNQKRFVGLRHLHPDFPLVGEFDGIPEQV